MDTSGFFDKTRRFVKMNLVMNNQMKIGTGSKTRSIKSASAIVDDLFEFNKSIVPHGGKISKLQLKQRRNGSYVIKLFQDVNNDGRVSMKEIIYKGQSRVRHEADYLTDFKGRIRLEKSMHRCKWVTAKYPEDLIACTREYIPTTFSCLLVDGRGARFKFDGIGNFATDPNCLRTGSLNSPDRLGPSWLNLCGSTEGAMLI